MSSRSEFEEFARDCVRLAGQANSPELRQKLFDIAREWMRAAMATVQGRAFDSRRPNDYLHGMQQCQRPKPRRNGDLGAQEARNGRALAPAVRGRCHPSDRLLTSAGDFEWKRSALSDLPPAPQIISLKGRTDLWGSSRNMATETVRV